MTCSQQPELRLSLNYTDGQRNMWSYYAPNGRRYRQILVEKQCLCGSRLNWTNWEDVTISPERLMGLEWRLTAVKCRASSGCVQIPTGVAAQMQEIWHKVWTKCRGNSGEEWLLRMTCTFEGIGRIAMWDYCTYIIISFDLVTCDRLNEITHLSRGQYMRDSQNFFVFTTFYSLWSDFYL